MRISWKQNLINLCPKTRVDVYLQLKIASKTQWIRKIKLLKNVDYILIFTFFSPNLIQIFHKNH